MTLDFSQADVIIVGSGPAGVSAAWPLVEAGVRVLMLDASDAELPAPPPHPSLREWRGDPQRWLYELDIAGPIAETGVSPKFSTTLARAAMAGFTQAAGLESFNFFPVCSLAAGGLSRIWGALATPYGERDLAAFGDASSDTVASYDRISNRIGVSGPYAAENEPDTRLCPRASQCIAPSFLWQALADVPHFDYLGARKFANWEFSVLKPVSSDTLSSWALLFARHAVTFRDLLGPTLFVAFLCWAPVPAEAFRSERAKSVVAVGGLIGVMALLVAWGWARALVKLLMLVSVALRWRNREDRLPVLLLMGGMAATTLTSFYMNIYLAAFTAPILLLTVRGLRNLSLSCRPIGGALAGFVLVSVAALPTVQATAYLVDHPLEGPQMTNFDPVKVPERALAAAPLRAIPGRHVVFVDQHNVLGSTQDPVWSGADVDDQDIVWLRDLDPAWTAAAQSYYRGRDMWLFNAQDEMGPTLVPYPSADLPAPAPLSARPTPDRAAAEALGARIR